MSSSQYPKIQCRNCKKIIQSSYSGEWVCCSCWTNDEGNTGVFIDSTAHYTRIGGHPDNVIKITPGEPNDLHTK